jgi:antitoxin YefM
MVLYLLIDEECNPMSTITASEARRRLYRLLDEVNDSHKPVYINGKRNTAVLVSEKDWGAICETMYLVSIPGMRESILKGLKTPIGKCSEDLDW